MPEDLSPETSETPAERQAVYTEFKTSLDNFFTDNVENVRTEQDRSFPELTTQILLLDADDGTRILLKRVAPGSKPIEGNFLQDIDVMLPLEGAFNNGQVDFNLGNDGIVRKRVVNRKARGPVPHVSLGDSESEADFKGTEALRMVNESAANLALEEQLGLNNTEASAVETKKVLEMVLKAKVANLS